MKNNRRLRLALLAVALLLAAALRLWRLEQVPPGLYHDEAYNGLDALSLIQGESFPRFYEGWELYASEAHELRAPAPTRWPIFFEGNYGREPLHIYLMALSISIFGNRPLAVRLVPALAGILAVLTTFLASTALEREESWTPIVSALALAIFFPAIHFSRFGIRAMLFVPCATLAVYAFWRGIGDQLRLSWLLVAGTFLGLGLYTYAAARLLPLLFLSYGVFWLFYLPADQRRRAFAGLSLMAGAALITAAPLLLFFLRYPYFFLFRLAYVANKGKGVVVDRPLQTWLLNIGRVLRGLLWQGETHLRHNLPGRPYMDPIQSAFFAAGLAAAVSRPIHSPARSRAPEVPFLLLWLGVMLLPSILSGDAPHFGRLAGVAPVLAIFVGRGVQAIVATVAGSGSSHVVTGGMVLLFASSSLLTIHDYFGRYATHPELDRDFYVADWELGRFAAAQPATADLYLTPPQAEMATIYFALGDANRLRSYDGSAGLVPAGRPQRPGVYLVRPESGESLHHLQSFFPEGETGASRDNFISFHVPASASRLPAGVQAGEKPDFAGAINLLGWRASPTAAGLRVTLAWQAVRSLDANYTAFVHLLGEDGALLAQEDRPPAGYPTTDWRAGEIVVDHYILALPAGSPASPHSLQTGFYTALDGDLVQLGVPVTLKTTGP